MSTSERRFGLDTPTGPIVVTLEGEAVAGLAWGEALPAAPDDTLAAEVARQIDAYFERRLTEFDLPLKPASGNFAQAMRQAMIDIPLGRTRTYGEIARDLGSEGLVPAALAAWAPGVVATMLGVTVLLYREDG